MSGGQQVDVFANPVNPAKPIYSHFYWTTPDATVANAPVSQLNASPEHKNTTAYLQDRWTMNRTSRSTLGLRWDRQHIIDAVRRHADRPQEGLRAAPRLRLGPERRPHARRSSAPTAATTKQIPMDLVIRSFSYERQPRIINYSPTSTMPDPDAEADFGTTSAILGGFTEPADPNLKNQYLTEIHRRRRARGACRTSPSASRASTATTAA